MKQLFLYTLMISLSLLFMLLAPGFVQELQVSPDEINGERFYIVHHPKYSSVELINEDMPFKGSDTGTFEEESDDLPFNIALIVNQTSPGEAYHNNIRKHRSMHLRSKRSANYP